MPTNPHTFEVQTDTALAEVFDKTTETVLDRDRALSTMHRIVGDRLDRRTNQWAMTPDEVLNWDTNTLAAWDERSYERAMDSFEAAESLIGDLFIQRRGLEAQYTGWSRFFIVKNNNGHVHSNMNCSTCYPTTQFGWLPHLSGLSEAEAVADQGEILCSVCFPSAPSAWCDGESNATKAAKAERAAAKAERDAKKLAKALLPDGSPLRLGNGRHVLKTLSSAKMYLTDAAWYGAAHPSYGQLEVLQVVAAVAAKTGEEEAAVWTAACKRAAKR